MPSEPARDLGSDPEAQLVLVRRTDLAWLMAEVEWCDTTTRKARLLAALNGEATTVDEKIKWGGEDGTEGRVTARRYCSPWLPVDRPEHSQLLAKVESERDEARWDASVPRTEQDIAFEHACEQLKARNQHAIGIAQWIRGMCSDEEDHVLIDTKLAELVRVLRGEHQQEGTT